jgi:hypothetical protein
VVAPAPAALAPEYRPRRPEQTVLYRAVQRHWETFRAGVREQSDGGGLPRFVERTFDAYLRCGILAHGFARVRCGDCGHDRLVALSCKRRGFCPGCGGRRMAEVAAHLVDRVLPRAPYRQWVLSLPFARRYRVAYDASLSRAVAGAFWRAVFSYYRRHAREAGLAGRAHGGAVTIVQRFAQTMALDPHYHSLVPDGVWVAGDDGAPEFFAFAAPGADEVAAVAAEVARRVARLGKRRGQPLDGCDGEPAHDALAAREPALAALAGASVQGLVATGRRRGCRVMRMGKSPDAPLAFVKTGLCAEVAGFDVHAGVRVAADDRAGLERLCRYLARPPLASDRLSELPDGRLALALRKPLRDSTHLCFEPHEFLEKLTALVPAPWANQTTYYGAFAAAAKLRPAIVPAPHDAPTPDAAADAPAGATPIATTAPRDEKDDSSAARIPPERCRGDTAQSRMAWAALLARVFDLDALACPRCGGRMKVVALITKPDEVRAILAHLGLDPDPPRAHPPRAPPDPPPAD